MASNPQPVEVPEPKQIENREPSVPQSRPESKPFTIKIHGQVPC